MTFFSSLQMSRPPFLLPSHNSSPSLSPSLGSTKTNQQLFSFIKPQSLQTATTCNSLLDRQLGNNVFITVLAFPTQMACCSFYRRSWWGRAPHEHRSSLRWDTGCTYMHAWITHTHMLPWRRKILKDTLHSHFKSIWVELLLLCI